MARLVDGKAFAQAPRSRMMRLVSNIVVERADSNRLNASAQFVLCELRGGEQRTHAGRSSYQLRETGDGFLICRKTVVLLGIDEPQESISFLI